MEKQGNFSELVSDTPNLEPCKIFLLPVGDDSESGVVADWSSEVAREEGRNTGYLTDSVLSRGRGGYRGRSRRPRGGYSSGRNSGS